MKLFLRRIVIFLALLSGTIHYAQAQTIGAGDLVFTGINIFDDNNNGSTQNDVFSFVLLRDCPANTTIYFTDLGWTGSGFQSLACTAGSGSQTDGVIKWSSGSTAITAGKQIVISCKYSPTATIGTVTGVNKTNNSASDTYAAWISLGLAGDQLFAFTGSLAAPTIIGGINVNRKTWETSLDACDFTSSFSVKPATSAVLDFPSINAVNARYNCSTVFGVPSSLRSQIQDTTKWDKDYTLSTSFPSSFNLKTTLPCNLTVVVPDANGIVYVNNQSATPGSGSSWSMPLPELRDALTAAAIPNSGITQIWVAKGTYKPTVTTNRTISFDIPVSVSVYGGFAGNEATLAARNIPANPVILSGDVDNNDVLTNSIVLRASDIRGSNSYHVITVTGASSQRVLDGVIITGGNSNFSPVSLYMFGGGIYSSLGDITITNTRFYGNNAIMAAGGLYNNGGNVQLSNCVFFGNSSGYQAGAVEGAGGTLKLTNVTIGGNSTVNGGGGLAISAGDFTAYNTIISGNTSANNQGDTYLYGSGTKNMYYSILDDQYYTNTASHQATPAVVYKDAANGDLSLTTANYGINKGDPQTNNSGYAAQAGTLDLAGQTRISNTIIDLGAYEYQAVPQTLTFSGPPMVATYGDENIAPGATTTGDGTVTYTSDNTAVAQIVNGKIKTTGTGSTLIKAYAPATNTYLPAGPVARLFIVNKKSLAIKADDVTRPYGSPNPAVTFTYTSFAYSEDASVLTGAATAVYGATQTSNVGTYPITTDLSGVSSNNYSLSAQNGTLTITQQQQTISFTLPSNATYGDAPLTLTLNTDAGLPIVYTVSGPASISGNTLTITGAGDITVTANQPGDANRAAAPQVQQTFTVAKAALTFTANDKTRPYNQANPALDYNITGFVNGENSSVLSGAPDISTTADISSPVANYPITITVGSLSAANYSFSFVNATLSITQAPQTITFPAIGNQTYGNPITLNATSSSGLAITYTVTSGPATISGNIVTTTQGGDVTITATQAGDANYTAAAPVPVTFRVFKRNLFLRIDNQQRPYGMNNPALTYTWDSFVNGDDASSILDVPQLSTTANASSSPGGYPITVPNLGDLVSYKYNVIAVNGTLTVSVAPQTISFPAITDKTYGDAAFALNATSSSGLPVAYSLVGGPVTLSGNNLTITGTGTVTIAADQAGSGNYSAATQTTQTFNVNKAALTVTANNKTKSYLQANPVLDYTITGFVNSENNSVVSGAADINTTADVNSTPGTYPITVTTGNLGAANYTFSFANGTLTVNKATQTISFPAITDKTYGDAAFTLNATSNSGLAVTYSVVSGPATISGNTVTITGAGAVTIAADQAGDANYSAAVQATQTFNVNKAALTVTANDKTKTYLQANPALDYIITGFVYNEDNSVVSGTGGITTTADINSTPGTYPITVTVGSLAAANYTFNFVNATLTVNQASQTISFPAITDKTYGDAAFALNATSNSGLTVTYSVVSGPATISGNMVTITGTGAVTIAADQAGDANYLAAAQATQTFNVHKAILTVTANDKTKTYLQANPALDYSIAGFVYSENNSVVSGTAAINTIADINSTPGTYPITAAVGSLSAANYTFSFVNGTLTVNQATQTISFPAIAGKTYGDAPFALTATSSSGLPVTYTVTSGPATINGNILTITGAGNVLITATQSGDANYSAAAPVSNALTVTKATLIVQPDDLQRPYGASNPMLTYTYVGLVNGDDDNVVSGTPILNVPAFPASAPGNYTISVVNMGLLVATNYTLLPADGTLTVLKAAQTISFPPVSDRTYGDASFALSASSSSSSGLPVTYSVVSGPATISGNMVTITGTGAVTIAADQAGDANYSAATPATQTFNVNKAVLTITANDKTKAYLQANPALDYTITGFVNSENNSVVSGTAAINTTANVNSTVGSYPITVATGSLNAANYSFSFVNGTLTVGPTTQTISFPAIADKIYGDAAFTLNATSNSGLPVSYSVVSGPATINGNIVTITGTGTVTIAANQAGDANYTAAAQATQIFNVNKAVLTVTANDKTKSYLQANPALDYTITGFVYSEDNTVVSGAANINTTAAINSTPGTYPITVAAGNLNAANYTFSFVNGTLTISQATQTISFPAITNKTYGDAAFTLNATSTSGLPVTYSVVSGPATIAGNTVTITGAGIVTIAANQAGDASYLPATPATQIFTVNKAVLTITANDKTRSYQQANPVLDYTISGFVNSENNSVVSGAADINTTAIVNSTPGTYPITVAAGSLNAANYTFSFVNGTLTVNQATQTISFPAITGKTYGDAPITLNASSSSGLPVSYALTSGPAALNGNTLYITGAGSITVMAIQPGDANYTAAVAVSNTFQVAPATLIVQADDKQKNYGANNPPLTYTITGFVNSENSSVVSGAPVLSTTANASSAGGTYPITVTAGTLSAANYTFSTVDGTLTISLTPQTISFPAITAKTYGDPAFTLNATSSSGLAVTYSVVSGPATVNGNTVTITGAGAVTIAADQAGNTGYSPAAQATQTFTVNKAVLTLTANDKNKIYLQANPVLDYVVSGFVNSENNSVLSGSANISTTANTNSTPGTYPITVTAGNLNAANYSFSFVNATLTITPASQSISFPAITVKTYGDPAFTLNGTSSSGLALSYTVTSGPATINGNTLTITGAGSVTVQATQAGNANYSAASPVSNTFQVAPATLTVQADDKQKIFGANNPALTYTITGFVYNENNSVVSGTPVLSTTATTGSATGTYPINITTGTLSAANYIFTTVNGTLTIGLTTQNINFPAITGKTYGDAAFTLNASSSSGLAVTYSVVSGPAAINGNTLTITGAGTVTIAADQAGNANYSPAAQATQSFNVAKAALTITASNDTRTYNGAAYAGGNGVSYTGFVNGDNAAKLSGGLIFSGTSQGAVNAGSYIITPAGLSSNNYNIAYVNGQLSITRATQQITFTAPANKNQGDPDFTLTATSSSGLPVTLNSNNTQVISLNGNTARVGITGSAVITASQAGDNNYEPAQSVTQTIQVNAWATPVITAQGSTTFCAGNTLTLQSTVAPAYEWYRNGILVPGASGRSLTVNESGSYTVNAIYAPGASIPAAAVNVTVNPLPVGDIQISGNTTISKGETIKLTASGGSTYTWSPAAGLNNTNTAEVTARPAATVTYQVTIASAAACSITKEITITVKEDFKLEATNLLTPNGDGRNDHWVVKNIDMYPDNEVMIFDRAGRIIYRQQHYANNWDGKLNGQPLAEGTYYYIVDLGENRPKFKGFITIILDK